MTPSDGAVEHGADELGIPAVEAVVKAGRRPPAGPRP